MASLPTRVLKSTFVFSYGLFSMMVYAFLAIKSGLFFKKTIEKEALELQLAHNRLWDLSKKWTAFSHQFHTLKNGFKFHYVSNETEATTTAKKPLVIFIHGFPDSWAIWRHILRSESLQENATLVAVDLPGYGGSDGVDRYSATTVLESLTEFIIAMRTRYGIDNSSGSYQQRVVVVSHDWGCVLSLRLASESPELADRFIVSNGPLVPLGLSNISRRLSSSSKMLKSFLRSPIRSRALLFNAIKTVKPIFRQLWASGYIFIFQLPPILVDYLGKGGNQSFLKGIHKMSYGKQEFSIIDAADCMASSLGPTIEEGKTETANGEKYADSAISPRAISKFVEMCSYYRDGTAFSRWRKSVETIASLHGIAQETGIGRTSSGAAIFDDGPAGALKASTTIVWGKKDRALNAELCLDGISDYLGPRSQVIELPAIRHWTPLEPGGRVALTKVIKWAIGGEREDIGAVFAGHDDIARVTISK